MIKDNLKNAEIYYKLSENLKKGFEWLKSQDLVTIVPAKYEIDGEQIFANVQEYETKTEAKYETHRKYIDIQYMIKGRELVGVTGKENCTTVDAYNPQTDLEFMQCDKTEEFQILKEGEFLVFYPTDAHKPSIADGEKKIVKKVIVKVAVD